MLLEPLNGLKLYIMPFGGIWGNFGASTGLHTHACHACVWRPVEAPKCSQMPPNGIIESLRPFKGSSSIWDSPEAPKCRQLSGRVAHHEGRAVRSFCTVTHACGGLWRPQNAPKRHYREFKAI